MRDKWRGLENACQIVVLLIWVSWGNAILGVTEELGSNELWLD